MGRCAPPRRAPPRRRIQTPQSEPGSRGGPARHPQPNEQGAPEPEPAAREQAPLGRESRSKGEGWPSRVQRRRSPFPRGPTARPGQIGDYLGVGRGGGGPGAGGPPPGGLRSLLTGSVNQCCSAQFPPRPSFLRKKTKHMKTGEGKGGSVASSRTLMLRLPSRTIPSRTSARPRLCRGSLPSKRSRWDLLFCPHPSPPVIFRFPAFWSREPSSQFRLGFPQKPHWKESCPWPSLQGWGQTRDRTQGGGFVPRPWEREMEGLLGARREGRPSPAPLLSWHMEILLRASLQVWG